MSILKRNLMRSAAVDVKNYIDRTYGIVTDVYDLMEILNGSLGFLIDALAEQETIFYGSNPDDTCNLE